MLAAAGGAQFLHARDLLAEADAARAVDAAGHVGGNQRTQVRVGYRSLSFRETRNVAPEAHGQILQLALAALIAHGAVQRMIDEQELHRGALRGNGAFRVRFHLYALGHREGAGRHRLGRPGHLHQAHTAICGHTQFGVVAKTGNIDAGTVGDGNQHFSGGAFKLTAVYAEADGLVRHKQPLARAPPATRPESWLRTLRENA